MRAAILDGPESVRIVEIERPDPGPGQVRIRVEGCGVCASNITPWEGTPWMHYPTAAGELGHEIWGRVDLVGSEVEGVRLGDRVAALTERGFAEYDLADAATTICLPPELDSHSFPAEPFGCAFNIFERSAITPGQRVAIVGIGFLGAILTRLASDAGATVFAISRRPFARSLARSFGADKTIPLARREAVVAKVKELTSGDMCERVIECTGKQGPLDLAGDLAGFGARLIVAGYHQDGPRTVNMQMWNWKGLDVINAHERSADVARRGMEMAARAVAAGRLRPEPLLTHRFPLEALSDAIRATRDKPAGFVKALVLP